MIVRIGRATVRAVDEPAVNRALRTALGNRSRPHDMLDVVFARHPTGDLVEVIVITLWTRLEALEEEFGPTWRSFGTIAGLDGVTLSTSVEHLTVFADEWPEFLEYLGRTSRLS